MCYSKAGVMVNIRRKPFFSLQWCLETSCWVGIIFLVDGSCRAAGCVRWLAAGTKVYLHFNTNVAVPGQMVNASPAQSNDNEFCERPKLWFLFWTELLMENVSMRGSS